MALFVFGATPTPARFVAAGPHSGASRDAACLVMLVVMVMVAIWTMHVRLIVVVIRRHAAQHSRWAAGVLRPFRHDASV